jgi:hypothetical protein
MIGSIVPTGSGLLRTGVFDWFKINSAGQDFCARPVPSAIWHAAPPGASQ